MLTVAEVNARRPRCARCGCLGDLLDVQDPVLRRELLAILRQQGHVALVKLMTQHGEVELGQAKATVAHVSILEGKCVRCKTALPPGAVVDCPKCRSVNLVWD